MLETLAIIALVYLLVAAVVANVANVELFTDFFGVCSPGNAYLWGLAWPAAVVALVMDAVNWVIYKLRF